MTNVYAWPPVGLTGWEIHHELPLSRSVGLIGGVSRTSSHLPARREATAIVSGIGVDDNAAGYVEVLKILLKGGANLVRVDVLPPLWWPCDQDGQRITMPLVWTAGGTELRWTSNGVPLQWATEGFAATGAPGFDAGWPAILVRGLPPLQIVAQPSQRLTVRDDAGNVSAAMVLTQARSDAAGVAVIRLLTSVNVSGIVSIGETESVVFEALDMPRAVQPVDGDFAFTWNFREVLAGEKGALVELNPWG